MSSKQNMRLCALMAALFVLPGIVTGCMDMAARKPEAASIARDTQVVHAAPAAVPDKPYLLLGEHPDEAFLIEAALVEQGYFREDVPLDYELQDVLHTACTRYGVDYALALGLIEVESGFAVDAFNPGTSCYGLMQLNPQYFPTGLTPTCNIEAGIAYLGEQLERYDKDKAAALTAYHAGYDTGSRGYADAVLEAAERWA